MKYTAVERKAFVDAVNDILEKAGLWFNVSIEWRSLWLTGGFVFDETCPAKEAIPDDKKKDWYESTSRSYRTINKLVSIKIQENLDNVMLRLGNFCNIEGWNESKYGSLSYKGDMSGALVRISEYVDNYKKVNKES